MLIGEFLHNMDAKGRINFPVKLRDSLGVNFVITRGLDRCLYAYSPEEWTGLEESIKTLPRAKRRNLERFFFAGAAEVQPDKQGRILVPQNLRDYAGLDKQVMVVGVSNHVEIWDIGQWESSVADLSAESIAQTMDELGF